MFDSLNTCLHFALLKAELLQCFFHIYPCWLHMLSLKKSIHSIECSEHPPQFLYGRWQRTCNIPPFPLCLQLSHRVSFLKALWLRQTSILSMLIQVPFVCLIMSSNQLSELNPSRKEVGVQCITTRT